MRLLVVIVNYKSADLAIDCLASVESEIDPAIDRVLLVENASGDDSYTLLSNAIAARGWGAWAVVRENPVNGGFAAGNNFGIKVAQEIWGQFEYTLLLNPDTIVRHGAVTTMLTFMEHTHEAGLIGSRLEDLDGTPQESAFRFPSVFSNFESGVRVGPVTRLLRRWVVAMPISDEPHRADWLCGASLMIREAVFQRIGLLDAQYFMYFEETDFCLAAQRAGFEGWYVPDARIVHLVGQSSGVNGKPEAQGPARRRPAYWFASRRRYFIKNHGRIVAALADLAWIVGFGLFRLRQSISRMPDRSPQYFLFDSVRNSVFFRGFKA